MPQVITTAFMKYYPPMFLTWKVYVHGDMIMCYQPVLVTYITVTYY